MIAGASDAVRSDEWAGSTAMIQIAVANDLGPRNLASPYKEELKAFGAVPSRDWSMVFKPTLWGFLVLDPAHAFALHYALMAAAMLIGFAILLRQFGCSPGFALGISTLLFLSQYVQLWWGSNAASFALAPWVAVIFLWRGPWFLRLPALTFATASWLISLLYPPFIIGAALALGVLILAFRREMLAPKILAPAVIAAAAGVLIAWLHFRDLIPIMQATVYPGERRSDGGGVWLGWLAAHIFPYLMTDGFDPLPRWPTNACEIAVVGTFLPLAAATFCDHRALAAWIDKHRWAAAVWVGGLGLMLAWMLLPIPARFAPLLNYVPPYRALWGFGLLLTLGLGVVTSAVPWRADRWRVAAFLLLAIAGWALSKVLLNRDGIMLGEFDLLILPIFGLVWLVATLLRRGRPTRRLALIALGLTALATFGHFNPVQSAKPIFQRQDTPTLDAFRAYAAANPKGWVIAPGMYGAVINAAGVPAINHTLMRPQLAFFHQVFPELGQAELNQIFNRYAHVVPSMEPRPRVLQADMVTVPMDRFAIPLRADIAGGGAPATLETFSAVRTAPDRWSVTAVGWAPWRGVSADQHLGVSLNGVNGRIVTASAFRLPRADIVEALKDPTAFAAGFGARVEIVTDTPLDALPANALIFTATGTRP